MKTYLKFLKMDDDLIYDGYLKFETDEDKENYLNGRTDIVLVGLNVDVDKIYPDEVKVFKSELIYVIRYQPVKRECELCELLEGSDFIKHLEAKYNINIKEITQLNPVELFLIFKEFEEFLNKKIEFKVKKLLEKTENDSNTD